METASAEAKDTPPEKTASAEAEAKAETETEAAAPPAPPKSASPFPEASPIDGGPLADVDATDPASIPAMIERARAAQLAWAKTPVTTRASLLLKVKRRILER